LDPPGITRDVDIRLQDATVSRQHARLRSTKKGWQVLDLGSKNGVFLKDLRSHRRLHGCGREFRRLRSSGRLRGSKARSRLG